LPRRRKQGRLSGKRYESFPFAVAEKAGVVRLTTADMFKRKNPAKAPAAAVKKIVWGGGFFGGKQGKIHHSG